MKITCRVAESFAAIEERYENLNFGGSFLSHFRCGHTHRTKLHDYQSAERHEKITPLYHASTRSVSKLAELYAYSRLDIITLTRPLDDNAESRKSSPLLKI